MSVETVTGYHFDAENLFYDGERIVQVFDGEANYPKYVLGVRPALKSGYWYKCKNGTSWTAVKKPTTCAEAVESGLSAVANSPKEHDREVVALLQSLVSAESDKYRIATDAETLVMSVEAIPEPTEEEKEIERKKQEDEDRYKTLESLKLDMLTALAINDTEWLEEIRAEYAELLAEEE